MLFIRSSVLLTEHGIDLKDRAKIAVRCTVVAKLDVIDLVKVFQMEVARTEKCSTIDHLFLLVNVQIEFGFAVGINLVISCLVVRANE